MPRFKAGQQILTALCLLLGSAVGFAQPPGWSALLEPEQLAQILDIHNSDRPDQPVRILRVTGDYAAGHIPGAVSAPYAQFRGPQDNAGQLPAIGSLQTLVQHLGIDAATPVVVVHQGNSAADMGAATRVYWTLKSLGVQHLAVLDGGFQRWQSANLPISTTSVTVTPTTFLPQWQDTWRISTAELEQRLDDPTLLLIDARSTDFFNGRQSVASRPGTIRGAVNLGFESWFEGNSLQSTSAMQHLLASSINVSPGSQPVTFCNTGHLGSINWFVLSELAGLENTRLYAESVVEWSQNARPMDNQPGRLAHYWSLTRTWLSSLVGQ
tara:strand:+ start:56323 stop:57297 length:975 start_codon:yes stop_codon:yes gene_type:complete